jgi:hypothetical protein
MKTVEIAKSLYCYIDSYFFRYLKQSATVFAAE